jgi:TrmH family RNA methyltransferase
MTTQRIESRDNPRLKLARKVRDGRDDKRIFVEGVRLAEEAVRSGLAVEFCLAATGRKDDRTDNLIRVLARGKTEIVEISSRLLSGIAETKNSQGLILICSRPADDRVSFENVTRGASPPVPIIVLLVNINNPSNLGAVVRSAEAAGAVGVIVSSNSADAFSPKALRATMGSGFRVPIWQGPSVMEAIRWAKQTGHEVTAATGDTPISYLDSDLTKPRLLIFGSEAHGVSDEILTAVDSTIRIPMDSPVESLNLAVSAGVILFEAKRQVISR